MNIYGWRTRNLNNSSFQTGIQKREASNCATIRHFENKFAVETLICSWTVKKNIMEKNLIHSIITPPFVFCAVIIF